MEQNFNPLNFKITETKEVSLVFKISAFILSLIFISLPLYKIIPTLEPTYYYSLICSIGGYGHTYNTFSLSTFSLSNFFNNNPQGDLHFILTFILLLLIGVKFITFVSKFLKK